MTSTEATNIATQAMGWYGRNVDRGQVVLYGGHVISQNGAMTPSWWLRSSDHLSMMDRRGHVPMWITGREVDVDSGTVTLEIGQYRLDEFKPRLKKLKRKPRRVRHRKTPDPKKDIVVKPKVKT